MADFAAGERVVLGRELAPKSEGKELVAYDYPGLLELLEYYTNDQYLADND